MLSSRTALITGVSSGIGKSILLTLLEQGCHVHGVVKTEQRKEELTAELTALLSPDALKRTVLHVCDLRNVSAVEALARTLHTAKIHPDILILNAGVGLYGPHEELSAVGIAELAAVNFTAPLVLTNLFLRDLKAASGHVLFISSVTAAKTNNTHGCAYGATKAGVSNFAKSLFEEVRKYGVRVTVLAPDMTRTGLYRNAPFCADDNDDASLSPEDVASYALFALTARDGLNLTELTMQPQFHRLNRTKTNTVRKDT
ncbi:MAG: SDR family NAD(P)-dependent oxidoreductase [Lachnospiraceae bacterium]|nr:SDR family NAD(P)-dependent oxidoreductase [Lachnospiraceae bacterium]